MSARYRISITQEAAADLRNIQRYIVYVLQEKQIANQLMQRIRKEILTLAHMPERIKRIDDEPHHSNGLRKLIVGNYVAIFLIYNDEVRVLRVMYGGMDIDKQLSE